ncbi:hypothetical protein APR50_37190 [Variovorax paradoxus]|uniref:helix-turn-helix domain-containing protein n=1 Tax=Variovorax TaxID=34072 RepID=UPI0006E61FCB|nr:hypothetical protein APR49_39220 [Variovorax paradoxus]KPU95048.1 hypothetical protein APR50_37190 [Variovorax paradoxus]KPV14441.1 hypothetical protein APR51_39060 [Variovorax paradoxus]KPV20386.1 hypothetical protein APR48_38935 [Variovorax paradoxus]KPV22130.1 hypothetical protein APR47_38240 [Variovorax paradoxus]
MGFYHSTEALAPRHKTEFWRESVCRRLIPARGEFARDFDGCLSGQQLASLTVCRMQSKPHTFIRTDQLARIAPDDDIVAAFFQRGQANMAQQGRTLRASAGDIVLYDAARPFVHELAPESLLLVRFPRQQLLSRFPKAEHMMALKIADGSSLAGLLHGMAEEALRFETRDAALPAQARFAAAFLDTLSAAMELQDVAEGAAAATRHGSIYEKAVRYIDAHLDDTGLSMAEVAEAAHVSPRTLTRVFAAHGTTVMHHLWKRRLAQSFHILSEGRVQQVTQAAYQCGFSDLSHFSRAFKSAYGTTPGSLLHGAAS